MHQSQYKNQARDSNIDREHTQQKEDMTALILTQQLTEQLTEQLNITIYGIERNTDPTS